MQKYKAAIFDMDGTLTDSMWIWDKVDDLFSAEHGVTLTEQDRRNIHAATFSGAVEYLIKRCNSKQTYDQIVADMIKMATYEYVHNVELIAGAKQYLDFLKSQNLPVYLLTSCTREMAFAALKAHDILKYFDDFYFADKPYQVKTKPAIFMETLQGIGKNANECVLFEDMPFAIKTAKSLGIYTVSIHATKPDGIKNECADFSDLAAMDYNDGRLFDLFN